MYQESHTLKRKVQAFFLEYPRWCTLILIFPYILIKAWDGGAFKLCYAAALAIKNGQNCYGMNLFFEGKDLEWGYAYSPLFAVLTIPFLKIPPVIPAVILLSAYVFIVFRVFKIFMELLNIHDLAKQRLWIVFTLAFSLRFILHNYEMVQFNLLLLYLSLEGLYLIFIKKQIWIGSFLLALGIDIKILPIVFLPYLIYRNEWKAFTMTLFFILLLVLAPALIVGPKLDLDLHKEWIALINPFQDMYNANQNDREIRIQGLAALIPAYFSQQRKEFFQIIIYPLSKEGVNVLIQISRLILILLSLVIFKTMPFKKKSSNNQFVFEISYLFLITPLIFPSSNKWAFVWLIPAFACIFYVYFLSENNLFKRWIALYLVIVFLFTTASTDGICGKYLYYYVECLKFLTIGSLLMIPLLMIANRQAIQKQKNFSS